MVGRLPLTAEQRLTSLVEAAERAEGDRQWERAARAWIEAARFAIDESAPGTARPLLERAAEAFRRDDRATEAERALDTALGFGPDATERARLRLRQAATWAETGRGRDGIEACRRSLGADPVLDGLLLDTLVGLQLGFARKHEARATLDELVALDADGVAAVFRAAQLDRLDGALGSARARLDGLVTRLGEVPGAEVGVAAAQCELAELDAYEGRAARAAERLSSARDLHLGAGRRALALRCDAAWVRGAVEASLPVVPTAVADGLAFANERGLRVLAIDLQIALAMAVGGHDPRAAADLLDAAIRSAERMGARIHAGRARVERAIRTDVAPGRRLRLLERAISELADHAVLRDRARALLAGESDGPSAAE